MSKEIKDYGYLSTFHFSTSPEVHKDDKTINKNFEKELLENYTVYTEKFDGGNAGLNSGKVYARSHSTETFCSSFTRLKKLYQDIIFLNQNFDFDRFIFYGENMQAIHSIKYDLITSPFYVFHILDKQRNVFLSWEKVKEICNQLGFEHVPEIGILKFDKYKDFKKFTEDTLKKESFLKGHLEGFVGRKPGEIKYEDFSNSIAKVVRKGHVQSPKHWKNNWKPQSIKEF